MRTPACLLAAALLAGGAFAQTAAPSVPSRPSAPSAPSAAGEGGVEAPTGNDTTATGPATRPSREIGGSGSAGLGAMGGAGNNAFGSSSTFGGPAWGNAAPTLPSRPPAPTMHDPSRDHCPPGQADRGSGCQRLPQRTN